MNVGLTWDEIFQFKFEDWTVRRKQAYAYDMILQDVTHDHQDLFLSPCSYVAGDVRHANLTIVLHEGYSDTWAELTSEMLQKLPCALQTAEHPIHIQDSRVITCTVRIDKLTFTPLMQAHMFWTCLIEDFWVKQWLHNPDLANLHAWANRSKHITFNPWLDFNAIIYGSEMVGFKWQYENNVACLSNFPELS